MRAAGQIWGLPEIAVLDTLPLPRGEGRGRTVPIIWQEAPLPLVPFAEAVGLPKRSRRPG